MKMLVKARGFDSYIAGEGEILNFSDISKEDILYPYIQSGVRYGIVDNNKEKFNPDETINREQIAQWIIKLLKYDKIAKAKDIYAYLSFQVILKMF